MYQDKELSTDPSTAAFAAAVYAPKKTDRSALPEFVARLKADNVSVAGILQESKIEAGDTMRTIDSVDITTGHRIPIKRPMQNEKDCGLDVSSLAETTAILRSVLEDQPDLVVVEKFGEQEQNGQGLLDEIMQIITEGIPLLIAVPEPALPIWKDQSGDLGATVGFTADEMQRWWLSLPADQSIS